MARSHRPRDNAPLPPPLPPETRTVGQLVAETIRLYGERFWRALPLGLPLAAVDQLAHGASRVQASGLLFVSGPFFTLAYAAACALVARRRPPAHAWALALAVGVIVFLPAAVLTGFFWLLAVAWLGFIGLVVPVALLEERGFVGTFRRARELGTADYVHAVGSLATLAIIFFLARFGLGFLLRSQGDNTLRAAIFLADLVLSPLLFLGPALLYFDQAARVESGDRSTRRSHADVRVAEQPDAAGRPDAEVEPRPPARSQSRRRRARR
jgi:hypothetical protein